MQQLAQFNFDAHPRLLIALGALAVTGAFTLVRGAYRFGVDHWRAAARSAQPQTDELVPAFPQPAPPAWPHGDYPQPCWYCDCSPPDADIAPLPRCTRCGGVVVPF